MTHGIKDPCVKCLSMSVLCPPIIDNAWITAEKHYAPVDRDEICKGSPSKQGI